MRADAEAIPPNSAEPTYSQVGRAKNDRSGSCGKTVAIRSKQWPPNNVSKRT